MLLTLVAVTTGAVLLPTVLIQVTGTRSTVNRTHALHAAQTGIEVAVAAIRAAYAPDGSGDRTLLPCGPLGGTAAVEARATYRVELTYYDDDPAEPGAAPLTCAQARSPMSPMARFAVLTSTGQANGTTNVRTLRGSYPLRVGPPPAPSPTWGPEFDLDPQPRMILAWKPPGTSNAICFDAGSGRPAAGTNMVLRTCADFDGKPNDFQQNWYYRENLTIATVGSVLAKKPMCLDAGAAPAAGVVIKVENCVTPVPARQRWYYNNFHNFELASSTGPGPDDWALSGICLNVRSPDTPGSQLVLGSGANCRSPLNTKQSFGFFHRVGFGQAGLRTLDCTAAAGYPCVLTQLNNFGMPSRCLDKYSTWMATMECKQNPDLTQISWNQLWRLPTTPDGPTGTVGPIVTVNLSGATFCLAATSNGDKPVQVSCDPLNPTAAQQFTQFRDTGDKSTSYRIVDYRNRCLTHANQDTDRDYLDPHFQWLGQWKQYKAMLLPCEEFDELAGFNDTPTALRQKWNAPFRLPSGEEDAAPTPGTPAPALSPRPTPAVPVQDMQELPPG
jgi:hypothetical protein